MRFNILVFFYLCLFSCTAAHAGKWNEEKTLTGCELFLGAESVPTFSIRRIDAATKRWLPYPQFDRDRWVQIERDEGRNAHFGRYITVPRAIDPYEQVLYTSILEISDLLHASLAAKNNTALDARVLGIALNASLGLSQRLAEKIAARVKSEIGIRNASNAILPLLQALQNTLQENGIELVVLNSKAKDILSMRSFAASQD